MIDLRPVANADVIMDDDVRADLHACTELHPVAEQEVGGKIGPIQCAG